MQPITIQLENKNKENDYIVVLQTLHDRCYILSADLNLSLVSIKDSTLSTAVITIITLDSEES